MINGFICFDRFRSEQEMKDMQRKALADNHGVFVPTHPLRKNGEIVGYFSVGSPGVPIVFAWLSTQDIVARESFMLINAVEDMCARQGNFAVSFPVPKDSPFYPLMEKMGYKPAGDYTFFVKQL